MKKRTLGAIGLAACAIFAMGSLVQADGENVKLKVMSYYDAKTQGEHYIDAWEQAAEELGYEVEVESMGSEDFKTKVKVALTGDELPDVFTSWGGTYPEPFMDAGAVLPIDDYLATSGLDYNEAYLTPYKDGNLYIIPNRLATYNVFYYNRELIEEVGVDLPETFDDLMEIVAKVQEYNEANGTNISTICLGDRDRWVGEVLYSLIVAREDKEAFRSAINGESDFTGEAFLKAAEKVQQLIEAGAFTQGFMQISAPEANELFIANDSLFYAHQSSLLTRLSESLGENLGVIPFPDCSGDPNYAKTLLTNEGNMSSGLLVSANTEYPEEACKLAFRFAEIVNEINVKKYGLGSFLNNVDYEAEVEVPMALQQYNAIVAEADTILPYWFAAVEPVIGEPMRDLSQKLYASAISPEDFVVENNKIMTQQ